MVDPTFVPRYDIAPKFLARSASPGQRSSARAALHGACICQAFKAMWKGASGTLCLNPATSHLLAGLSIPVLPAHKWAAAW